MGIPDHVARYEFPDGYAGTARTVELMARIVRDAYLEPRIRARVRQLLVGTDARDFAGRAERVWRWILERVTYIPNPLGVQHLTRPERLDLEIDQGEAGECCASEAMYAAALFAAAGVASRFVIIGWDPSRPDRFKHCYLELVGKGGQVLPFDPVGAQELGGEHFGLGDSLHYPGLPIERWSLDGERLTMGLLGSALGDCCDCAGFAPRHAALGDIDWAAQGRIIADDVKQVAPVAGPYGALVSLAIQAGESVFDAASGQKIGRVVKASSSAPAHQLKASTVRKAAPLVRAAAKQPPTSGAAAAVGVGLAALIAAAVL